MLAFLIPDNSLEASSFRRRRTKERKDDTVYGKDWSSMDRDFDRAINGYAQRGPRRQGNPNRNGYQRNPNRRR
jgi:hypothetical protein